MNVKYILTSVFLCYLMTDISLCKPQPAAQQTRKLRNRLPKVKAKGPTWKNDPDLYLEKFGYLPHITGQGNIQHSPESRREAIKNFQRMTGLPVSGRIDKATQRKMLSPRCGLPDVVPEGNLPQGAQMEPTKNNRRLRPENFYVPGYKWNKKSMTWRATNYSPDMASGSQRRAFYNAFRYWSDVTPLKFSELGSGTADIMIKFAYGDHGDGYGNRFDQSGGVLAHAFYPEDGDTHFDESELWTEGTTEGTNLEIVAAHEFGHALGLGHSNVPDALMAPYYNGYVPDYKLHTDDIQAIQSLYGASSQPKPPTKPKPTSKPSNKPNSCTTKFDALLQDYSGKIFAFKHKWIWQLNYWGQDNGYPILARKVFDRPPLNIGAAVYSWRTRYTYFFKGDKIFQYYGFQRIKRKTVTNKRYPKAIHAAFMSSDGNIYLLQGNKYYIFDEYKLNVKNTKGGYTTQKWPGVPDNIEAAVRLNDGYLYFIKGIKYRKYDEARRQVLPGYPKSKAGPWMGPQGGCTNGDYIPK